MTLAEYLEALNTASAENGPWTEASGHAETLNGAFATFAAALATYVSTAKELVGYDVVRDSLESVFHTFPVKEEGDFDPFAEIQAALIAAMGLTEEEVKELLGDDA